VAFPSEKERLLWDRDGKRRHRPPANPLRQCLAHANMGVRSGAARRGRLCPWPVRSAGCIGLILLRGVARRLVVSSSNAFCRLTGVGVTVGMWSAASAREATMYPATVRYQTSYPYSAVQAGCCCGHRLHVFCFMHRRLDACVQVDTAPDALVLSRRMAWLLVVGCAASALHGLAG
jgi:hypothetical protein